MAFLPWWFWIKRNSEERKIEYQNHLIPFRSFQWSYSLKTKENEAKIIQFNFYYVFFFILFNNQHKILYIKWDQFEQHFLLFKIKNNFHFGEKMISKIFISKIENIKSKIKNVLRFSLYFDEWNISIFRTKKCFTKTVIFRKKTISNFSILYFKYSTIKTINCKRQNYHSLLDL